MCSRHTEDTVVALHGAATEVVRVLQSVQHACAHAKVWRDISAHPRAQAARSATF